MLNREFKNSPTTVVQLYEYTGVCKYTIHCGIREHAKSHGQYHNQLLLTKFEKKFAIWKNDVKENWTANREDIGTRLGCFGSKYKMAEHFTRFAMRKEARGGGTQATKYIAKKSRIQLHGRHLLFGECL